MPMPCPPRKQLAGLFELPPAGFDPLKPWRLEFLVNTAGTPAATVPFGLDYKVPDSCSCAAADSTGALAAAANPRLPRLIRRSRSSISGEPPVAAWVEAWNDARVEHRDPCRAPPALTLIFVFQDALARHRLAHRSCATDSSGRSGLARLDRRRAALDRARHQLPHGAVRGFRPRLLPRRAADRDHRGLRARLGGPDRARRVLRLALPVRRAPGAARPDLAAPAPAAMEPAGRAGAAAVAGQIHRSRGRRSRS